MLRAGLAALVIALCGGCDPYGDGWSYACTNGSQCGADGRCIGGQCAFVDGDCASGYRYGELSGPLANQCWMPDGGMIDGDGSDAMPGCLGSYLVCDGFETTVLDPRWTSEGMVVRDTMVKHRGNASLRMHTNSVAMGGMASARIWEGGTLAGAGTTVWVRAWLRVSQLPVSTNAMELFDTEQSTGANGNYVFVRASDLAVYSGFDTQIRGGGTAPTNTWFCLIWKIDRATTATGALALSGDQFAEFTLNGTITDAANRIATLRFGIYWIGPNVDVSQPAVDLWIDDIITSATAVSCTD